jgi:predicted nucleic acid-binding protein
VASIEKATNQFIDTNVLLYLLSADTTKANRAEKILAAGGTVSIQVLNEFASVASRKLKMSIAEIREVLSTIRALCKVVPLNEETHDRGLQIAEKHKFSIYDAMIVAAALLSDCNTLLSEDMQHGQKIDSVLKIQNPFR